MLQEISAYGVSAVDEGTISGGMATLTFQATNGVTGQGQLYPQNDETMRAPFVNSAGGSNDLILHR